MNLTRQQLHHPLQAFREVKTSASKKLGLLHAPGPLFAKVEITRRCNLNCEMCYRTALGKERDMDFDWFRKAMRKLPKVHTVALHGYGEPLMCRRFWDYCHILRNHDIKLYLVTNGIKLTDEIGELLMQDFDVHMVAFSVDSGHMNGYGRGYADKLGTNIRNLINYRNQFGNGCKVIIHSTIDKNALSNGDIDWLLSFAFMTNVDAISFNDITIYEHGTATESNAIRRAYTPEQIEEIEKDIWRVSKELGVNAQVHINHEDTCHWLWRSIYIDVSGNVYPCTDTLDYPFGNIFTDDFDSIWNGKPARDFRSRFLSDPVDECRKCVSRRE